MGIRSKLLVMLIIYFSGFATAIYYLAPDGRVETERIGCFAPKNALASTQSSVMDRFCDKTFSKVSDRFSGMNSAEFKEKFNLGLKKLIEMSKGTKTDTNTEGK